MLLTIVVSFPVNQPTVQSSAEKHALAVTGQALALALALSLALAPLYISMFY